MVRRLLLLLCLVVGLVAFPKHGTAQPQPASGGAQSPQMVYDLAFTRYKNGLYEDAARILRKLLSVPIDPEKDKERAKVYLEARPTLVACLFGIAAVVPEGQAEQLKEEADEVILQQYLQDPFYDLPPGYSQTVTDRWTRVKFENEKKIEALQNERIKEKQAAERRAALLRKKQQERIEKLEEMARHENFVETRSRVVATIPFGVGQFQNDDVGWGIFFATSEVVFIASSIVSWGIAETIIDTPCPDTQIDEETNELRTVDCDALLRNFEIARVVNYASLGTTAALVIAGIIQAQVAFEPERTTKRDRELPPPVTVEPTAFVTPSAGYFGIVGRF
jgi:hypothetical protein